MAQTAEQFLKERRENPPEPKKCSCGAPLGPRVDGTRKTIDGKEVCDDCYFDAIGANIERHPIHTPGRHGPGVMAHLDVKVDPE